eukprot:UN31686
MASFDVPLSAVVAEQIDDHIIQVTVDKPDPASVARQAVEANVAVRLSYLPLGSEILTLDFPNYGGTDAIVCVEKALRSDRSYALEQTNVYTILHTSFDATPDKWESNTSFKIPGSVICVHLTDEEIEGELRLRYQSVVYEDGEFYIIVATVAEADRVQHEIAASMLIPNCKFIAGEILFVSETTIFKYGETYATVESLVEDAVSAFVQDNFDICKRSVVTYGSQPIESCDLKDECLNDYDELQTLIREEWGQYSSNLITDLDPSVNTEIVKSGYDNVGIIDNFYAFQHNSNVYINSCVYHNVDSDAVCDSTQDR